MNDEKKPSHDHTVVGVDTEAGVYDERASRSTAYRTWTNSWVQIMIVSMCAFCLPGMFNAMSGMGGGGNVDPYISAASSVALTATGAASYFLICVPTFEFIGVKSLLLGGWTYALYSGSLLNYSLTGNGPFVIASGTLLGLGSAFFWLSQGAIMLSYPLPHQKGRAIALFWIIFNLGGMIGAFAAFGNTVGKVNAGTLSPSTYWAFIGIMIFGAILCGAIAPPHLVARADGSRAGPPPRSLKIEGETFGKKFVRIVKREILNLLELRKEPRVLFLIPMFFSANWFYSYQQNIVNGKSFNLDGRTLNSALYWGAQMFGGFLIGGLLDVPFLGRRNRAIAGWVLLFVTGNAIMGGGLAFEYWREAHPANSITLQDGYAGPAVLYFCYGLYDSLWQSFSYWMLGAMCSTPSQAGKLVAVYKVSQSVGASIAYKLTADNVSDRVQFASNWALIAGSLVIAIPAVLLIKEPTAEELAGGETPHEKEVEREEHEHGLDRQQ